MPTLYLLEQGAVLSKEGRKLVVEKQKERLLEVPVFKVDRILIFGNIQITTQTVSFLFGNGIETSFLTLSGRLKGKLSPLKSKNVILRMRQYEKAKDKQFTVPLAKRIVSAKIKNSLEIIRRHGYNHPEIDFSQEKKSIQQQIENLKRKTETSTIIGIEGISAVAYYKALAKMFRGNLKFSGRNRRPPKDGANALLSFGYVLVGNEIQSVLESIGFDPYIVFLHGIDYGRPSLALDLLEEFRQPLVDRFVLFLSNNRILTPEDFEKRDEGGVYLKQESKKEFFRRYEEWMNSPMKDSITGENTNFRKLLLNQAHRLADTILHDDEYIPFTLCS